MHIIIMGDKLIDKIPINSLREITKLPPLFDRIRSKSLKLFGHTKRTSKGISKVCVEGIVCGKRGKGMTTFLSGQNVQTGPRLMYL